MAQPNFVVQYNQQFHILRTSDESGITDENFSQFMDFVVSHYPTVRSIYLYGNDDTFTRINSSIRRLRNIYYLERISLNNLNMDGIFPPELFEIAQLQILDIELPDIYSIPPQIVALQQLSHLNIDLHDNNEFDMSTLYDDVPVIQTLRDNDVTIAIGDYSLSDFEADHEEEEEEMDEESEEEMDEEEGEGESQDPTTHFILPPEPTGEIHEGFAFQVHNEFNTIFEYLPVREYFAQIIELIKPYNLNIPEINPPFVIPNKYKYSAGVYNAMAHMILKVYNGDQDKNVLLQKYNVLFQQIYKHPVFHAYSSLIFLNVVLIISLNHLPLINLYIETYVKDCTEAYEGRHGMSCDKGIIERYILNFKQSVQVLCCNGDGCENPKFSTLCSMFTFMDINNNILLNDLIRGWTEKEDSIGYNTKTPESRRNSLIDYLMNNVFGRNVTVPSLLAIIRENLIKKLSTDPFDKMNFDCKDKLETVIDPEDCEKGVDEISSPPASRTSSGAEEKEETTIQEEKEGGGRKRKNSKNRKSHKIRHSRKKKMNKKHRQTNKQYKSKSNHVKNKRTRKIH
jgi:hypothetical protein